MNNQIQFRQAIHLRDRSCLITRVREFECDCAHIIPYTICDKYAKDFIYDIRNGLFLCKNLHALYDKLYWTFDIYDIKYNPLTNKYSSRLIILPNHMNLSVNNYKDAYVDISIETYPFIYAHYQVFISVNFEMKHNIEQLYYEIVTEDPIFKHICTHELPIDDIINKQFRQYLMNQGLISVVNDEYYVNTIIKHKTDQDKNQYLVWWDHLPYLDASWEPSDHISKQSKDDYHRRLDLKQDQDYIQ